MKFGKHLKKNINKSWRFHFINYCELKNFLKANSRPNWGPKHEECFIKILDEELKKVSAFEALKYKEIERHIDFIDKEIFEINSSNEKDLDNTLEKEGKERISAEVFYLLDLVTQEISDLANFNSLNYTGMSLKHTFLIYLASYPFYKETFDVVIVKLSNLYEKLKQPPVVTETNVPTSSFVRKTTKYWIHPDNVMKVKCQILKHLPVLVFGRDDRTKYDSCISSLYYDNEQMDLYHERIEKVERALAIRFRWYGEFPKQVFVERKTHQEDWTGEVSIKERFPIKEKHINNFCKGLYEIKRKKKDVESKENIDYILNLSKEIQNQIKTRNLKPVIRTFYNRTAFQLPNSAEIRISLDTELTMIKEEGLCNNNWFRKEVGVEWPFHHIDKAQLHLFPYAILEVKLQTAFGEEPPDWISELTDSNLVECVPKFSKFIHGCATLVENKVRLLPFWLPQMEKDIRKPSFLPLLDEKSSTCALDYHTFQTVLNNKKKELKPNSIDYFNQNEEISLDIGKSHHTVHGVNENSENDDSIDETTSLLHKRRKNNIGILQLFANGGSYIKNKFSNKQASTETMHGSKRIAIPIRIEPKVFFANERTFLNWLHTATILSTIGLALLNMSPLNQNLNETRRSRTSLVAGLTLVPMSILFLIYALYTYFRRDRMIRNRSAGQYNSTVGPIVITIIFISALSLNYILWLIDHGFNSNYW